MGAPAQAHEAIPHVPTKKLRILFKSNSSQMPLVVLYHLYPITFPLDPHEIPLYIPLNMQLAIASSRVKIRTLKRVPNGALALLAINIRKFSANCCCCAGVPSPSCFGLKPRPNLREVLQKIKQWGWDVMKRFRSDLSGMVRSRKKYPKDKRKTKVCLAVLSGTHSTRDLWKHPGDSRFLPEFEDILPSPCCFWSTQPQGRRFFATWWFTLISRSRPWPTRWKKTGISHLW